MRRRTPALLCVPLSAIVLSACGAQVSTSDFKGEQHAVAQAIANFQSHATSREEDKLCKEDLSASIVSRLGGTKSCEEALKKQLKEADDLELKVESVSVAGGASTATARVKSLVSGKRTIETVSLAKEGKVWKLSSLG